jgi:Fe-S cluster assembly iron-binding protein IscA
LGLTLDESTDEDKQVTVNEIDVLLDPQVARFADEQVIHFVQDGFSITSKKEGGCGSSCGGSCG